MRGAGDGRPSPRACAVPATTGRGIGVCAAVSWCAGVVPRACACSSPAVWTNGSAPAVAGSGGIGGIPAVRSPTWGPWSTCSVMMARGTAAVNYAFPSKSGPAVIWAGRVRLLTPAWRPGLCTMWGRDAPIKTRGSHAIARQIHFMSPMRPVAAGQIGACSFLRESLPQQVAEHSPHGAVAHTPRRDHRVRRDHAGRDRPTLGGRPPAGQPRHGKIPSHHRRTPRVIRMTCITEASPHWRNPADSTVVINTTSESNRGH